MICQNGLTLSYGVRVLTFKQLEEAVRKGRIQTLMVVLGKKQWQSCMVLERLQSLPPCHTKRVQRKSKSRKAYCAYCKRTMRYLSQCSDVAKLSKDQLKEWILVNKTLLTLWKNSSNSPVDIEETLQPLSGKTPLGSPCDKY